MPDQAPAAPAANALAQAWNALQGAKTHIVAGLGLGVVLISHFGHVTIPGVTVDDANWLNNAWELFGVMAGRSALAKVQGAFGNADVSVFVRAAQAIIAAADAQKKGQ